MFWGGIGVVISLAVMLGLVWMIEGELPLPFLIVVIVAVVPGTLLYLWTHRAADDTRFIPK